MSARPFGITYYRRVGRSTTFSTPQARYGSHEAATEKAKKMLRIGHGAGVYRVNVWRAEGSDRRLVSFHIKRGGHIMSASGGATS